jgi:predicted DNA-binding transcriptional regulator AlpA
MAIKAKKASGGGRVKVPAGGAEGPADRLMTAADLAKFLSVTGPTIYTAVKEGRLPAPVYPGSKSPRWLMSEVLVAVRATRAMPAEAAVARSAAARARKPNSIAAGAAPAPRE